MLQQQKQLLQTGILFHSTLTCRRNKTLLNCITVLFQGPHKKESRNDHRCSGAAVGLIQYHRSKSIMIYTCTYMVTYNRWKIIQTHVINKFLVCPNVTVCGTNIPRHSNMLKAVFCWTNIDQWYWTCFVRVPLDIISLQLSYSQSCWCINQVTHCL